MLHSFAALIVSLAIYLGNLPTILSCDFGHDREAQYYATHVADRHTTLDDPLCDLSHYEARYEPCRSAIAGARLALPYKNMGVDWYANNSDGRTAEMAICKESTVLTALDTNCQEAASN